MIRLDGLTGDMPDRWSETSLTVLTRSKLSRLLVQSATDWPARQSVLGLGVDETPNLINLIPLAGKVAKGRVLIIGTHPSGFRLQLRHNVYADASVPGYSTNAHPLGQERDDLNALVTGQLVHAHSYMNLMLSVKHLISIRWVKLAYLHCHRHS
jgi:hypothetical protein